MSEHKHAHTKFRPALSLELIQHIVSQCSDTQNHLDTVVRKILIPLIAKIEIGAISPSYKVSELAAERRVKNLQDKRYLEDMMTPEESAAYERDVLGLGDLVSSTSEAPSDMSSSFNSSKVV